MVGSVNIVAAPEPVYQRAAHARQSAVNPADPDATATASTPGREADDGSFLAAPERLGYAKLSQLSGVLTSLASARTGERDLAARALQAAEQKLRRLKAQALAAAASGDKTAAAAIARELADLAREIADDARDYAAVGGEPGLSAESFADAAAEIDVGTPPGQDATAEMQPAAASFAEIAREIAGGEPGLAGTAAWLDRDAAPAQDAAGTQPALADMAADPTASDRRASAEGEPDLGALLHQGSGAPSSGQSEDTVEAHAHDLLEEVYGLIRAMKTVLQTPSAQAETAGPAFPAAPAMATGLAVLAVWATARRRPQV